jgi:histone deacetylase 1/2
MSRVAYYYNQEIGNFYYGPIHPMKPHRVRITHELVKNYGMLEKMHAMLPEHHQEVVNSIDFTKFHTDEYVDFINRISPDNMKSLTEQLLYFNIGEDCPVFEGLVDYCKIYTTGSILGAYHLNHSLNDITINWSGGLHHAKKHEASGFCYINDCVLGILELLTKFQKVLYIDIDIHHGDGVEEAFFTSDRVLTCSFHKYGDFFPGTGALNDIGWENGRYTSVNFPLYEGMDDISYEYIFKKVIDNINEKYRPDAIVMQCGSDSLSGDRLGCFNLSIKGHGNCLKYVKSLNLPLMILGGGGYTLRNVPRCWTWETAIALGIDIDDDIPKNDYLDYFYPEYKLHMPVTNMENANTPEYLNNVLETIDNNLKQLNISSANIDVNSMRENYSGLLGDVDMEDVRNEQMEKNPEKKYNEESSKPSKKYMEF